jgi:hypothetical protein
VALALGEFAQCYLPGRTAESTEFVLALVLGLILYRLERKYGSPRFPAPNQPAAGKAPLPGPARPGIAAAHRSAPPPAAPTPEIPPSSAPRRPGEGGVWTGGRRRGF